MFALRRLALAASVSSLAIACSASSENSPADGGGGRGSGGAVATGGGGVSPGGTGGVSSSSSGSGGETAAGSGGAMAPADAGGGGAPGGDGGPATGDGGGLAPANPSAGCGTPAGQALAMYVPKTIMSGGMARSYRLYLPDGYEPTRAYPTIILAHGCGGNGGLPFPIETASKNEAIVVALKSVGGCFVYSPTGMDVTYFDDVLAEVSANHCVDKARVFMAGFSSGSWLTHTIGCVRAGVVRAQGNASGNQVALPACKGPIAALFAHDVNDNMNSFAGAAVARDRILKSNGCGTQTQPYDWDGDPATPSTCVSYQGCMAGYPVVWCPTMAPPGKPTHNNQVPITTVGLWRFWKQF
ncbi:MAG TPA: hypothetical protein VMU50_20540 [Polyangia bacterium]|nr:hypothetical protein [Polyangia bacterium]